MFKKVKQLFVSVLVLAAVAVPVLIPVSAQAVDINKSLTCGVDLNASENCVPTAAADSETKVNNLIATVINLFSLVVGVVSVIMIIVGGLKYITSGGDSGNVTGAKNTILYAIIGLVVVALAQFIVRFVLARATA